MKKNTLAYFGALICSSLFAGNDAPSVRITVHVTTVDGQPIPKMEVGIGGGLSTPDGQIPRKANGLTDEKGNFSATIASREGIVSAFARAHGYYEGEVSAFRLYPAGQAGPKKNEAERTGRWEPLEQTIEMSIRPIKNPVPMYAKHVAFSIPAKNTWLGYDIQKADWSPPYGNGAHADLEFFYEGSVESNLNYDGSLSLRFPGAGDGIQSNEQDQTVYSELRTPYEAPENGFGKSWSWRSARITGKKPGAASTFVDEKFLGRNFIFRVRSVLDPEEKIVRAWYGKIYGPILLDPRGDNGCGYVEFTYYCNPDGTRNLEFDPKRNLFPDQNIVAP